MPCVIMSAPCSQSSFGLRPAPPVTIGGLGVADHEMQRIANAALHALREVELSLAPSKVVAKSRTLWLWPAYGYASCWTTSNFER
jgi:hypothetical protein